MIQITECLLSTKELVVYMATTFFAPVPLFLGGNYSLYFVNITTAHASNSLDFHFSKYVKMSKWPEIA